MPLDQPTEFFLTNSALTSSCTNPQLQVYQRAPQRGAPPTQWTTQPLCAVTSFGPASAPTTTFTEQNAPGNAWMVTND